MTADLKSSEAYVMGTYVRDPEYLKFIKEFKHSDTKDLELIEEA